MSTLDSNYAIKFAEGQFVQGFKAGRMFQQDAVRSLLWHIADQIKDTDPEKWEVIWEIAKKVNSMDAGK